MRVSALSQLSVKKINFMYNDYLYHFSTDQHQKNPTTHHSSLLEVMYLFQHTNISELKYWCSEFVESVCQNHINLARKAMRMNTLWKQPQLLRLPDSFDQIFEVKFLKQ